MGAQPAAASVLARCAAHPTHPGALALVLALALTTGDGDDHLERLDVDRRPLTTG